MNNKWWEKASKESPLIGIDNDMTGVDNLQDAKNMDASVSAREQLAENIQETPQIKKPNLGVTALESLAKFGKNMSENQPKIESPKFNTIDTKVDENSDLVAIKKAILARMAGR